MVKSSNRPGGLARWKGTICPDRTSEGLKTMANSHVFQKIYPKYLRIGFQFFNQNQRDWQGVAPVSRPSMYASDMTLCSWTSQMDPKSSSSLWPAQGPGTQLPETAMLLVVWRDSCILGAQNVHSATAFNVSVSLVSYAMGWSPKVKGHKFYCLLICLGTNEVSVWPSQE